MLLTATVCVSRTLNAFVSVQFRLRRGQGVESYTIYRSLLLIIPLTGQNAVTYGSINFMLHDFQVYSVVSVNKQV
jgi:hypothetical protein